MDELDNLTISIIRNHAIFFVIKGINEQLQDALRERVTSNETIEAIFKEVERTKKAEQVANKFLEDIVESVSPENLLQLILEMILCRDVEELDRYLSQMLKRVFRKRPEILRASENKILVSEVLQCTSIDEVILKVAESKVQALGYKGLKDIIKYMNSELGLNFDIQMPAFLEASEMFQVRNIIVHNASIVNEIFLQNTGRKDLEVGKPFPLTEEYVTGGSFKLTEVGRVLDQQFKSHFQLN